MPIHSHVFVTYYFLSLFRSSAWIAKALAALVTPLILQYEPYTNATIQSANYRSIATLEHESINVSLVPSIRMIYSTVCKTQPVIYSLRKLSRRNSPISSLFSFYFKLLHSYSQNRVEFGIKFRNWCVADVRISGQKVKIHDPSSMLHWY